MVSIADVVYFVTSGPVWRRRLLTPVALGIVAGLLLLVVLGSLTTDSALGVERLVPEALAIVIGMPLLVAGLALHGWCILLFKKTPGGGGIGVPFDPPRQLVVMGPYAWTRNPMVTAFFLWLTGLGFILNSTSMVFLWTPAFLAILVIELKVVEEPELERRFGVAYGEYKAKVPMFVPRRPAPHGGGRGPAIGRG